MRKPKGTGGQVGSVFRKGTSDSLVVTTEPGVGLAQLSGGINTYTPTSGSTHGVCWQLEAFPESCIMGVGVEATPGSMIGGCTWRAGVGFCGPRMPSLHAAHSTVQPKHQPPNPHGWLPF